MYYRVFRYDTATYLYYYLGVSVDFGIPDICTFSIAQAAKPCGWTRPSKLETLELFFNLGFGVGH